MILAAILLVAIFKFDWGISFFGLEYEDAYVFNFSSRQFYENIYSTSFLTDGILLGSIEEPLSTGTYGGHFITFPIFLSWFYYVFNYFPEFPSHINSLIEFLTVLVMIIYVRKMIGNNIGWFVVPLFYCFAPAMNLFGTTQLSETFSGFIVLVCVISLYSFHKSRNKLHFILFLLSFFVAILTKRENVILMGFILFFQFIDIYTPWHPYKCSGSGS
jgi:hypothetical protein